VSAAAWVALAVGVAGLAANFIAFAVGYGVIKGTSAANMQALEGRLKTLETEVGALSKMGEVLARLDERTLTLTNGIQDLNERLSWLDRAENYRDFAESSASLPPAPRPRRRKPRG